MGHRFHRCCLAVLLAWSAFALPALAATAGTQVRVQGGTVLLHGAVLLTHTQTVADAYQESLVLHLVPESGDCAALVAQVRMRDYNLSTGPFQIAVSVAGSLGSATEVSTAHAAPTYLLPLAGWGMLDASAPGEGQELRMESPTAETGAFGTVSFAPWQRANLPLAPLEARGFFTAPYCGTLARRDPGRAYGLDAAVGAVSTVANAADSLRRRRGFGTTRSLLARLRRIRGVTLTSAWRLVAGSSAPEPGIIAVRTFRRGRAVAIVARGDEGGPLVIVVGRRPGRWIRQPAALWP